MNQCLHYWVVVLILIVSGNNAGSPMATVMANSSNSSYRLHDLIINDM